MKKTLFDIKATMGYFISAPNKEEECSRLLSMWFGWLYILHAGNEESEK